MRTIYIKMLQISSAFGLIFTTSNAQAIECTLSTDCASMGYTLSASDCSGLTTIKCPFDTSKVYCKKTQEQETVNCEVGDILYGNGTCAGSSINIPSNLTPIGVVFDSKKRLAVSFTNVTKSGYAGTEYMQWSEKECDVPNLPNCDGSGSYCGTNGRTNTDAILATNGGCSGTTYAAKAANLYEPKGCSASFCKKGQWFLPSAQELRDACERMDILRDILKKYDKTFDVHTRYWTSSESINNISYGEPVNVPYNGFSGCSGGNSRKTNGTSTYMKIAVRPVVKY